MDWLDGWKTTKVKNNVNDFQWIFLVIILAADLYDNGQKKGARAVATDIFFLRSLPILHKKCSVKACNLLHELVQQYTPVSDKH